MNTVMKRGVSIILVFCMCLSILNTALANEDVQIIENNTRIENAVVDVSCFSDEELNYVEKYVVENDEGLYYIKDETILRSLLTEQQYMLVEEQIKVVNENSNIKTRAAVGTSSNPYELTEGGLTRSSASSEFWYKCTTWGATDFYIDSDTTATMVIYKKTLFGKNELARYTNRRYSVSRTISDCSINNGANTYLISIEPNSSTTVSCKVNQHVDKYTNSSGAIWTAYDTSAIPDTNMLYFKYWYVPADDISYIIDYVEDTKFLDYQEKLVNGTITASTIALSIAAGDYGKSISNLTSIITGVGSFALSNFFDFKSMVIDEIREAAGYNSGTQTYSNGVLLKLVMADGISYYFVESWEGNTMTGPAGWTGKWSTLK